MESNSNNNNNNASKMWSTGERNGKPLQYSCLENPINSMTNLDSILKSRDITLPAKVHIVKAMVFSTSYVWM